METADTELFRNAGDLQEFESFELTPYDPEKDREWIRGSVALAAFVLFSLVIAFYLYQSSSAQSTGFAQIKEAMQAVLPAVSSVLGTVLGFYFGSQKR